MRDPEFVMYFSIESMQYANEEFTNIAEELPVSIELDVFNDETLRRALQAIADFLDCNSLQCQSVLDASGKERNNNHSPPSGVNLPSPPHIWRGYLPSLRLEDEFHPWPTG
jgi:hypothetical protein